MSAILFIEANAEITELVHTYFNKEDDIQVTVATNVQEARAAIKQTFFDLLVVDVMDGATGDQSIEFVKELRMEGIWIPACCYTTRSKEDVLERVSGYNCLDLIPKDVSPDDMVSKVKDMLYITSEQGQKELSDVADLADEIHKQFDNLLVQMNSCCTPQIQS